MVQVTFMGTGAAFSSRRRTNVAMLVQEDDTRILVECGPTILYQLDQAGSGVDRIDYVFVSHRHGDHVLGLPLLLLMRSLGGSPKPATILGAKDVIQTGKNLTQSVFPELAKRLLSLSWVDLPEDGPGSVELGASIRLSTMPVPHSAKVPSLALRLDFETTGRSLVYTGDLTYFEGMAVFAAGCDLLVHEANFSETVHPGIKAANYGHSTARQAGQTAAQAGARILALVHLSPDCSGREDDVHADAAQAFGGQIIVPNDGAMIYL